MKNMLNLKKTKIVLLALIVLLLITSLLIFTVLKTYSLEESPYDNFLEEDKIQVESFTREWITEMYNNDGTYLDNIVKVINKNKLLVGYIIEFKNEGRDNGYLKLDKTQKNHVTDFSTDSESVVDIFNKNLSSMYKTCHDINEIYNIGFDYYVETPNRTFIDLETDISYALPNEVQIKASSESTTKFVLDESQIPNGTDKNIDNIDSYYPVTTSDFDSNNHCVPTAIVNLM